MQPGSVRTSAATALANLIQKNISDERQVKEQASRIDSLRRALDEAKRSNGLDGDEYPALPSSTEGLRKTFSASSRSKSRRSGRRSPPVSRSSAKRTSTIRRSSRATASSGRTERRRPSIRRPDLGSDPGEGTGRRTGTAWLWASQRAALLSILWFALTREALRLDWKLPVTASVR
jgi:hypothetical protein